MVFQKANLPLVQIFDSIAWPDAPPASTNKWAARATRVWAQIFGTRNKRYLDYALRRIDEGGITCVLAFWGTRPLPDIQALKRKRPHVRFVLTVLCHPIGLTPAAVFLQNRIFNHAMQNLDGLIVSSSVMQRYFHTHVPGSRRVPTLLQPPCWAAPYVRTVPLEAADPRPNVIFLGRMDWRAGQSTDNVTGPLRGLMQNGIDVHYSRTPESQFEDEHARPFDALAMRGLIDFAARFDASLILYDLSSAPRTDRFEVTVPDRLITSVAAGIPIALPSEGYAGCKEYLQKYGAVLEFRSMEDLANQLRDRTHMDELRKLAAERCKLYRAEEHWPVLLHFLKGATGIA